MKLLVVIVNFRTADLTIDCLQSLDHELRTVPGLKRVVVTNNTSNNKSVEKIQAAINTNHWN